MAKLPNFLVIIRSEKLSGKGQGRGAKKRTFRFGKKNVSFPKVETFRFADYTKISIDYPKSYKEAVTRKSVRMLLSNEKKRIEQFKEQGLISQEEAEQMVNELGERHNKVFTSYQFLK